MQLCESVGKRVIDNFMTKKLKKVALSKVKKCNQ